MTVPRIHELGGDLYINRMPMTLEDAQWLSGVLTEEYRAAHAAKAGRAVTNEAARKIDALRKAIAAASAWARASGSVVGRA